MKKRTVYNPHTTVLILLVNVAGTMLHAQATLQPTTSYICNQSLVVAAFASQSLLTGLGSVQFISNLVFVVLVLKEKVPRRCVLATFLIVVGNIILVVFGSKESPSYSVAQLAARYRQDSMAAYMMLAYAGGTLHAHCVMPYASPLDPKTHFIPGTPIPPSNLHPSTPPARPQSPHLSYVSKLQQP